MHMDTLQSWMETRVLNWEMWFVVLFHESTLEILFSCGHQMELLFFVLYPDSFKIFWGDLGSLTELPKYWA